MGGSSSLGICWRKGGEGSWGSLEEIGGAAREGRQASRQRIANLERGPVCMLIHTGLGISFLGPFPVPSGNETVSFSENIDPQCHPATKS